MTTPAGDNGNPTGQGPANGVTGQGPAQGSQDEQRSAGQEQQPISAEKFRELQVQLEKANHQIQKLSEENGKHRNKAKEEERARIEAAQAAGDLKPQIDALTSKVSELEPLAAFGERARQRLQQRVERDVAKLPKDLREKLEAIGDLEQRADALDFYLAAAGQQRQPDAAPPEGGPPAPPNPAQSVQSLLQQGLTLDDIRTKHPKVWEAEKEQWGGGGPQTGAFGFLRRITG